MCSNSRLIKKMGKIEMTWIDNRKSFLNPNFALYFNEKNKSLFCFIFAVVSRNIILLVKARIIEHLIQLLQLISSVSCNKDNHNSRVIHIFTCDSRKETELPKKSITNKELIAILVKCFRFVRFLDIQYIYIYVYNTIQWEKIQKRPGKAS